MVQCYAEGLIDLAQEVASLDEMAAGGMAVASLRMLTGADQLRGQGGDGLLGEGHVYKRRVDRDDHRAHNPLDKHPQVGVVRPLLRVVNHTTGRLVNTSRFSEGVRPQNLGHLICDLDQEGG